MLRSSPKKAAGRYVTFPAQKIQQYPHYDTNDVSGPNCPFVQLHFVCAKIKRKNGKDRTLKVEKCPPGMARRFFPQFNRFELLVVHAGFLSSNTTPPEFKIVLTRGNRSCINIHAGEYSKEMSATKTFRHGQILRLVSTGRVGNQEELRRGLAQQKLRVTQATLSRDLHELKLVKTSAGYKPPSGLPEEASSVPPLVRALREFLL